METVLYHVLRASDYYEVVIGESLFPSCLNEVLCFVGVHNVSKIKCVLDLSFEHWEAFRQHVTTKPLLFRRIEPAVSESDKNHNHILDLLRDSSKEFYKLSRYEFMDRVRKYYREKYGEKFQPLELREINYVTGTNSSIFDLIHGEDPRSHIMLVHIPPFNELGFGFTELVDRNNLKIQIESGELVSIVDKEVCENSSSSKRLHWTDNPFGTNGAKNSQYTFYIAQEGANICQESDTRKKKKDKSESDAFEKIKTYSQEFRELINFSKSVAAHEENVLILGDTGVGKELFAKGIHENSMRKNGPFIAVNCAAIPEYLFESEMFGYEKGAFTGAVIEKKGYFQLAHTGTLFLDEIGDLHIQHQAKILRAIQEKNFMTLGADGKKEVVDVRLICATNKDILKHKESEFRSDLLFRIGVLQIRIPSLKDRHKREISDLMRHFMLKMRSKYDSYHNVEFDSNAHRYLCLYDWPGNVRQLESFIYNILIYAGYKLKKKREHLASLYRANEIGVRDIVAYKISESEVKEFLGLFQTEKQGELNVSVSKVNTSKVMEEEVVEFSDSLELSLQPGLDALIQDIVKNTSQSKQKLKSCKILIDKMVHERLLKDHKSEKKVGEILNVSQQAVSARLKRLGIKS